MIYRGIVSNGVVILEGDSPSDGTVVDVIPRESQTMPRANPADHPAMGLWKDRTDLPADPVEASKALRQKLMRRDDE